MKKKLRVILPVLLLALLAALRLSGVGAESADIGIIGGADGPTAIFVTGADTGDSARQTLAAISDGTDLSDGAARNGDGEEEPDEDGVYDSKDDVALYIKTFGHLPYNYMTKSEAQEEGWTGGSLEKYCPGMCIGGDRFGNREGLLPKARGRSYTECDIDTLGAKSRGAKRIVFSNDGLIYYTDDHYESFTLLYGEP